MKHMGLFGKWGKKAQEEPEGKLPEHVAVIMDGNGRWAKKRGLPRTAGHTVGAEAFKKTAVYMRDIGVKTFTVYAFSTENWKRPKDEVGMIFRLLIEYIRDVYGKLTRERMRLLFIGDLSAMPAEVVEEIDALEKTNPESYELTVNICINYGGRADITRAVRALSKEVEKGALRPEDITEEHIARGLYMAGQADPDLLIRTGGEIRLSNFLLWQSAYSELYFTDVYWPDFGEKDVDEAILHYQRRNRRFGGL